MRSLLPVFGVPRTPLEDIDQTCPTWHLNAVGLFGGNKKIGRLPSNSGGDDTLFGDPAIFAKHGAKIDATAP